MHALITTDNPTYMRRLVRAIKDAIRSSGAYANGSRVMRVRYTGRMVATVIEGGGSKDYDVTHDTAWRDGNGQEICASRLMRS